MKGIIIIYYSKDIKKYIVKIENIENVERKSIMHKKI